MGTYENPISLDEECGSGWISWFCSLYGHEVFVQVDEDFIKDGFNLFGLKTKFPSCYDKGIEMILGKALRQDEFHNNKIASLYPDATDLYGLIHARYILTPKGLLKMKRHFQDRVFGVCPRVGCEKHPLLPVGLTEELRQHRVRYYCPMCQETYVPNRIPSATDDGGDDHTAGSEDEQQSDIDGAFFGPSFPHVFLLHFTALIPRRPPVPYVPKVFGYRVHKTHSIIKIKLEAGEYGKQYKKKLTT